MEPMRDEGRRVAFRQRLQPFVRDLINKYKEETGMSDLELSMLTGIPTSRLSEIQRCEEKDYPRALSENTLERLIRGHVFTVEELKRSTKMNKDEKAYLDYKFSIVEDEDLVRAINKAKSLGLDPAKIIQKAIARAKN